MPVTSSGSSVKRWPATEIVLDRLRTWAAAEAGRRRDLEALGYFGSYARGDEGFGSDLDLVAVVARSPVPFPERARDWKTETLPVPADLLVYTADEWETLRNGGGRFARVLAAETTGAKWSGRSGKLLPDFFERVAATHTSARSSVSADSLPHRPAPRTTRAAACVLPLLKAA